MSFVSTRTSWIAPRASRRRRAFTLIELLVVIAVIVILAGLMVPVSMSSMAHSRSTHCKSNLGQIGKAMLMYGHNYDLSLPPFGYYRTGKVRGYSPPFWSQILSAFIYPHLSEEEALDKAVRCPLWRTPGGYARGYTANYGHVFRYVCPGEAGPGPLHEAGSMAFTEFDRPSATMLVMDGSSGFCYTPTLWTRNLDMDGDGLLDTYSASVPIYNGGAPFRHLSACNVVFADGHVRSVRPQEWLTDNSLWDPYQ